MKPSISMEQASKILKLLGERNRLTMMKMLEARSLCVCEFVELFNISQPAISQHLRKLKDLGLIQEEKKGQWVHYSINSACEYYPFVKNILDSLPDQFEIIKNSNVQCNVSEDSMLRK
ncbi:ArsR/SmtB family transcription factor [Fervidibacillus halotolerans]|uniref:Metalloregulator ArsR/SmtB family transcription factor n=1 Tax=Fervidibacillus halotolerans TaxID=2980027 RepID=A0A9E8M1G2_9BACI|nr:metalloregulator ArsR/SmtB family transcription factor [Fervidibacillus halotolerans]WAA13431.1 metalloregulator ArsR/SmtB family transcription factor [Fervidibacillus halotolerans]